MFHGLLCRLIPEHLPGGIYDQPSEDLVNKTKSAKSVMKRNKLPEFVFGQLDQLIRYRPNATILVNESFIIYSHKKTRNWLETLTKEEREQLVTEPRKEGRDIRQQFKCRIKEIKLKCQEQLAHKRAELKRLEKVRLQRDESLTNLTCYYGLWQSPSQIAEGLERLPDDSSGISTEI